MLTDPKTVKATEGHLIEALIRDGLARLAAWWVQLRRHHIMDWSQLIHAERASKKTITWLLLGGIDWSTSSQEKTQHHFLSSVQVHQGGRMQQPSNFLRSQRQTLRPYPYSWFTQPNCVNCTYMVVARHWCHHLPSSVKLAHVMDNWFVCILVYPQTDMSESDHGVLQ